MTFNEFDQWFCQVENPQLVGHSTKREVYSKIFQAGKDEGINEQFESQPPSARKGT